MPDPRALAARRRTCSRYWANGLRCTNPTNHRDGWCRAQDCPGYSSPVPEKDRFGISRRHSSRPVHPDPCPLDAYDAADLDVSLTATSNFRTVHPGHTRQQAEASIRSLVEDLAVRRRWYQNGRGYLELAHMGYFVVISPDLTTVVTYKTSHAERTWSQVKAGVRSRGREEKIRRKRTRRWERRARALRAAGVTFRRAPEKEPDGGTNTGEVIVFTSPHGQTVSHVGWSLDMMAAYQWQELVARIRQEWGVNVREHDE